MESAELEGKSFRCLEGCGFCCTFQPEVSNRELALLRKRLAPRPVPIVVGEGRSYLQLQNKCGACTLLERRGCAAYEARPAHCRYFPFHLHFAEVPEVYVNWTCRGVERASGGSVRPQFEAQVLQVAREDEIQRHVQAARETYAEFQRRARRADVWGDVAPVVDEAIGLRGRLFAGASLLDAARRGGEPTTQAELLDEALEVFGHKDVTARPYYLAPDLRWITFARQPEGVLDVLEMDEAGALTPVTRLAGFDAWGEIPAAVADALAPYLAHLLRRRLFTGSVYALVDERGYGLRVEEAAWLRLAEIAADLVVRARVLAALGTAEDQVAAETARFYDSHFLDSPTIGGFL